MFYQVTVNFNFTEEDEANDFFHDCEVAYPKTAVINPGDLNAEPSWADLIDNRHNEYPTPPSVILKHIPPVA